MTGYPFILLSVVLPKLLSNLPSVFICIKKSLTDERRLKRRYDMSIHYRSSHRQDISTVDERRKEETIQLLVDVVIRVSISAILYCCPSLVLLSLQYIKTKHYVFKKAQI